MRLCRLIVNLFAAAYALALALLVVGVLGLFGQEPDPLSAVFVVILGQPWASLADGAPAPMLPWVAAAAPAVNLLILAGICRILSRRRRACCGPDASRL